MNPFRRDDLATRLTDRVQWALRPGWTRSVVMRRVLAVMLVLGAVAAGVLEHRGDREASVIVAAHELTPGEVVAADDLTVVRVPGAMVPQGSLRLTADGIGRTVVGRVRPGEIITDSRILSPLLPAQLTGRSDARIVPVRLVDDGVSALLREGDVVDVLDAEADVLARRAVVALTASPASGSLGGRNTSRPIMLAMDEASAHRVAAAGIDTSVAVVLH